MLRFSIFWGFLVHLTIAIVTAAAAFVELVVTWLRSVVWLQLAAQALRSLLMDAGSG